MRTALPLVLVSGIGVVTAVGWTRVLTRTPPPAPTTQNLLPAGEAIADDEALAAIAQLRQMATIRCAVNTDAAWPFERATYHEGVLRAVVPGTRGSRVLFTDDPDLPPVGILRWSGASPTDAGGCEVVPTAHSSVSGTVEIEGRPNSHGIRIRVCGETLRTDENGGFRVAAWAGQRCLAFVAEPDLTQGFVPFLVEDLDATRLVVVAAPQEQPGEEIERRYVIPKRTGATQALSQADVSPEAATLLQRWASQEEERTTLRQRTTQAAASLLPEHGPEKEALR